MDKNKGFACSFLPIGDKGESGIQAPKI